MTTPDINIPEAQTINLHLASANPHPQYLLITNMVAAFNHLIGLADLNDVTIDTAASLQNKVLTFDGEKWTAKNVDTIVTQVPDASYADSGIVRLATIDDVTNTALAAVTPATMKTYVSSYVSGLTATNTSYGTVRILSTAEQHANAITAGDCDGMVEWVGRDRYVNVHWVDPENAENYIYSTYATAVSQITEYANVAGLTYEVYRDGIISQHENSTNLKTNILVHSAGTVYGITTCGQMTISHEAVVKRANIITCTTYGDNNINVNTANDTTFVKTTESLDAARTSATYAAIQKGVTWVTINGSVHDLTCSPSGWLIVHNVSGLYNNVVVGTPNYCYPKCIVAVNDHGHLEYATVENAGIIQCGGGGIVEHVVVHDTQSTAINPDHNGLIIESSGSGYHITLNGDYARATIMGYAEDVRVYSGCVLDMVYSTAKVKNLTLYNGAYLRMTSSASVDGLVQYPGAIIDADDTCSIVADANCHEPDKIVSLVDEISNIYNTVVISGEESEVVNQYIKYHGADDYITNLDYSTAMLIENAKLVDSRADTGETPTIYTGEPQIYIYSTDAPRGLIRVETLLETSLNKGLVPTESRYEVLTSAFKYSDAKLLNRYTATKGMTRQYIISAPEGMYEDLTTNNAAVDWRIIF